MKWSNHHNPVVLCCQRSALEQSVNDVGIVNKSRNGAVPRAGDGCVQFLPAGAIPTRTISRAARNPQRVRLHWRLLSSNSGTTNVDLIYGQFLSWRIPVDNGTEMIRIWDIRSVRVRETTPTKKTLMTERTYEFNWDIIGDLQEGRPNLGDQVNVVLYRLMQYTFREVIINRFGNEGSSQLFHEAGIIAGRFFFEHYLKGYKDLPMEAFLVKLRSILDDNGIRFVRVDAVDDGKYDLSIATGVEGGLSVIQTGDGSYDTGFVEGIFAKYTGKNFKAGTVNTDTVKEISLKMGDTINLVPYRMLQYTVRDVAEQRVGTAACDQLFYDAGIVAGHFFFENFLLGFKELPLNGFVGELQRILKELGVGVLRIEKADAEKGEFVLTVSEDLDCSGLPDLGLEVCNYDEGFIAGIFHRYTGIPFKAKEVDCWCSGDRTCRFAVNKK